MSAIATAPAPNQVDPVTRDAAEPIRTLAALEQALSLGLLEEWRALVAQDPRASMFQTPGWCLPWYRCYHDTHEPLVIPVRAEGALVGIVPMAIERRTRRLLFASDSMADYRDIVALPPYRLRVVEHLIDTYLAGRFAGPLQLGWLDPASDTGRLVEKASRERNLRFVDRQQPCYRWFPPPPKKPSAQKFLNWFKRQGDVSFEVIATADEWRRFREEYYRQHSLRQIQAGRKTAFDDPRHRAFYDALFDSADVAAHVTAFRLNGRTLAGHFGYVWRGVLLLGPPTIDLEHEQRSPSVILLAWIIQHAPQLGLTGFDLTIGDTDFKKRLGNSCVQVTQIDIYRTRGAHLVRAATREAAAVAKGVVAAVGGTDAWRGSVKPAVSRLVERANELRQLDVPAAVGVGLAAAAGVVHQRRTALVYSVVPQDLRPASRAGAGPGSDVRENRIEDLLLCRDPAPQTSRAMTECARSYARLRGVSGTLHTLVVDGRLAGWACSSRPTQPVQVPGVPGGTVHLADGTTWIHGVHIVPAFEPRGARDRLVRAVLERQFADGATTACTSALEADRLAREGFEGIGFRPIQRQHYERIVTSEHVTVESDQASPATEFQSYLADEWLLFAADETRQREARRAVEGLQVSRVLDVGCGGGQDLIPFASAGTTCVGVDVSRESGVWATRQFRAHYPDVRVRFLTSAAEHLPFTDGAFDVVLCRVAIPYTDNRQALAEMARVLRTGGALLLKTHSPRYYTHKFVEGIRTRSPLFSVHALRVLLTGSIYHATGRQPDGGLLLRETFQTRWQLERELKAIGLGIGGELADSNPLTRSYCVTKRT